MELSEWFHGSISRSKAEDLLGESEGAFIVRAGLNEGEFYLSVRVPGEGPKYRHIPVNRRDNSFPVMCGADLETRTFDTFSELISYMKFKPTNFPESGELMLKDYIEKK